MGRGGKNLAMLAERGDSQGISLMRVPKDYSLVSSPFQKHGTTFHHAFTELQPIYHENV
jgi:hypothetical protein